MTNNSNAIGIDLGTTHCCVGYLRNEKFDVDIIENQYGDRTTPSYVGVFNNKEIIGKPAQEKVYRNNNNVIFDSKRLIGRLYDDENLQNSLKTWPFKVICSEDNIPLIQITKTDKIVTFKPHKISAKLLAYMKKIAEQKLKTKIHSAVITVPAYFNYHQRIATRKAGKIAKLHVLKIMNEPTAAVLAYVHKNKICNCKNILVFDLGGGTFDVSVVNVHEREISVKATSGNTFLGGRDFDNNLTTFIFQKLKEKYDVDVTLIPSAARRIYVRSEQIKTELSFETKVSLDLANLFQDNQEIELTITREDFENINNHLFITCIQTVENCMKQANVRKRDIEKILLIGGSTRIPKLRLMLTEYFEGADKLTQGINPDEAVAYGASVEAATYKKDNKIMKTYNINEVTPLSLGIDVMGSIMSFVIARNTPIPVSQTKTYITVSDQQAEMAINIYEGERYLVKYNTKIGTCIIKLPPRPPGYPVRVSFNIDTNGILEVGTTNDVGIYSNLSIEYEKRIKQQTEDALCDALKNKEKDEKENAIVEKWIRLKEYSINLKSLCVYQSKIFTEQEKSALIDIIENISHWVNDNKVKNGTDEEEVAITNKKVEVENLCKPILEKYGYRLSDMCISEFYKTVKQVGENS